MGAEPIKEFAAVTPGSTERLEVSLNTPAGQVTTPVDVPRGPIAASRLVPIMRRLGEQALALEERTATTAGHVISCRKGCAACCRMLVPVSAPEAFALKETIDSWPAPRRERVRLRMAQARTQLEQAGLYARLLDVAETTQQLSDDDLESVNRAYYALRLPCPFLEDEVCAIYEDRPAACRELLVTSPAELCRDIVANPVQALPVPIRIGTALALLWARLTEGPMRFIPLPLAWDWADRHAAENHRTWPGLALFDQALDKVWRYLSREIEARRAGSAAPSGAMSERTTDTP